jgi:hypothetical protein
MVAEAVLLKGDSVTCREHWSSKSAMGIILIPLFLAMLLGFSCPGIGLGVRAVLRAQGRLTATLALLAASVGLGLCAVVLPFAVMTGSRVSAWGFIFIVMACVAGILGAAGAFGNARFRATGRPVDGLLGAASFLAAGRFPVMWFWLAPRLEVWFRVGWIY